MTVTGTKNQAFSVLLSSLAVIAVTGLFVKDVSYCLFLLFLGGIALIFFRRPEVAISVGLFLAFDLIPGREILPIRGGMKPVFLILLVVLVACYFLRKVIYERKAYFQKSPMNRTVALFIVCLFLSGFVSHFRFSIPWKWYLQDSAYWYSFILYFLIVGTFTEKRQIKYMINFLIVFANLSAILSCLQWVSGSSVPIISSLFEVSHTGGTLRVVGTLLPIAIIWPIFLADLVMNRCSGARLGFYSAEFLLFSATYFIQFTRAYWISAVFSLVAVVIFSVVKERRNNRVMNLAISACIVCIVVWMGVSLIGPRLDFWLPYKDRLYGMITVQSLSDIPSYRSRQFENQYALKVIGEYPLTGAGIGNRDILTLNPWKVDSFYGIHNNFLFLGSTMGLPALGIYLLLVFVFFFRTYRNYTRIHDPYLISIFLGNAAFFAGRLVQGVSTMNVQGQLMAYLALIFGVNEVIINLSSGREKASEQSQLKSRLSSGNLYVRS